MNQLLRLIVKAFTAAACALLLLGSASVARAQVTVSATALANLGFFDYAYSVVNNTGLDLAIVTINVPALPAAVLNPLAPLGFIIEFDSGLGLLSFLEDADPGTPQTFGPGLTVSGFTFRSSFAPSASPFEALDIFGNSFGGSTIAPNVVANPVSQPAPLMLILAVIGGMLFVRIRREPLLRPSF